MMQIEMFGPAEGSFAGSPEEFDHDAPPTHEDVQASQPELGAPKKSKKSKKKSKAKKPVKKASKKASKSKSAKRKTKAKAPKAKPAAKVTQKRGVPHDGSPRKSPGTAPAHSEAAAKFGRKVAKARAALELSQKALAQKTGFTQPGIANIERGRGGDGTHSRQTANKKWQKLVKVLGLDS